MGKLPFPSRPSALLGAVLALLSGCAREPVTGRTVILVLADTWRGDHWLEQRAGQALTPTLSEFSGSAEVYRSVSSTGNCTSPGTAGVLTGLFAHRSTVDRNRSMLPQRVPTLASILRDHGFRTAAFVGNPVLRPGMGFEQGFDEYEWISRESGNSKTRAGQLLAKARDWLDGVAPEDDMLLWLHFMEPHGPYRPPAELDRLFDRAAFGDARTVELLPKGDHSGRGAIPYYQHEAITPPSSDPRDYLARYAAEVRAFDDAMGRLLDELDRRGRLEGAVVVVSSDHGEALEDDHGFYFSHANGLTEDQLQVPLLLSYPGCRPGYASDLPASTADIVPTVLGVLGIASDVQFDGVDLRAAERRPILSQQKEVVALRMDAWRLVRSAPRRERLYALRDGEEREVPVEQAPADVVAELRRQLNEQLARPALAVARLRPPMDGAAAGDD